MERREPSWFGSTITLICDEHAGNRGRGQRGKNAAEQSRHSHSGDVASPARSQLGQNTDLDAQRAKIPEACMIRRILAFAYSHDHMGWSPMERLTTESICGNDLRAGAHGNVLWLASQSTEGNEFIGDDLGTD